MTNQNNEHIEHELTSMGTLTSPFQPVAKAARAISAPSAGTLTQRAELPAGSLVRRMGRIAVLATALGLAGATVQAADADKTGYSLANPTPTHLLRELSTDRPDATESPYTVDAGHLQLEMNLADYERTRLDGDKTVVTGVAPFNLRLGVRHNLELGVFVSPYTRVEETPRGGPSVTTSGFGDVTLRGKWNFWGNDGGPTAMGLMVDLTLPTAKNGLGVDKAEGAMTFPVAFELPGGWEGAAMTALELVRNDANTGYRAGWFNTVTAGHAIAGDLSGFLEITSSAGHGRHVAIFNCGLTYALDFNTQLDCGLGLGVSRTAPDVSSFVGLSKRF